MVLDPYVSAGSLPSCSQPSQRRSFHSCPERRFGPRGVLCCLCLLPCLWELGLVDALLRPLRLVRARGGKRSGPRVPSVGGPCGLRADRPARIRECLRMRETHRARGPWPTRPIPTVLLAAFFETTIGAPTALPGAAARRASRRTCYLVDPASSHMLVSKIKPCMCKYEPIHTVKLRMAH